MQQPITRDISALSLNTVLEMSTNSMAIRALLNPLTETLATSLNISENATHSDRSSATSPTSVEKESFLQLPPIKLSILELDRQQSTLPYHLRSVHPTPPPSPYSASYQQQAFISTSSGGCPTPPPSSPHQHDPRQTVYYSQDKSISVQPQLQAFVAEAWHSTRSLSPIESEEEHRAHKPHWHVPVQVHTIHLSHSPKYHNHSLSSTYSRLGANRITKPPKRKRQGHHSNKPYTPEQVHWVRYHREDLRLAWPDVHRRFVHYFRDTERMTESCLSSRYYRNNVMPKVDENGDPVLDANRKVVMISAKVRDRATAEGKMKPYTLVDKHPEFALVYDWVGSEDKERALRILKGLEAPTNREQAAEWQKYQQAQMKIDGRSQELVYRIAQANLQYSVSNM